jgi:surface antigen
LRSGQALDGAMIISTDEGISMAIVTSRTRSVFACIVALGLAAAWAPARAQSAYDMLKGAPAEKFNDEDRRLFRAAAEKALNSAAVGESVLWENPATQSGGDLKVLKTFTWKDSPCRQVRVRNHTTDRKATNSFNLCRVSNKWRMVSPSELKKG